VSNPLTRADVEHVAKLARLALSEEEVEQFTVQLGAVLEHFASVAALDTSGVPPTSHVLQRPPAERDDEVQPSLDRAEALANAPDAEDGFFGVPAV
jgi:aspartyl-tRNA(Asn)/glutamyl-tRNA(Gln) amidotransferase subunit C